MRNFMNNGVGTQINVDKWLLAALEEDITSEDVTTAAIMREPRMAQVDLICKEDGVLAGITVYQRVFELLGEITFETSFRDGQRIQRGDVIGRLVGPVNVLLSGERTALNYLQRMSGIATMTARYVRTLEGTQTRLLDTRKTTPGMRLFEKYAVRVGGGQNHRYNLSDGILLKDNHIAAAGGVKEAITLAKDYAPFVRKIEVEVENLEMVAQALQAGADIIMLDNMTDEMMREAVEMIGNRALTECSGNVTLERLAQIAQTGVNYVSCGALTHSAPILDFSMKNLMSL
ncbi:MAG: carboxylating nicotinate-nucleotide diphosphorylase [Cellulosilyticaceae bacterium]